jgi:hypothetical protein
MLGAELAVPLGGEEVPARTEVVAEGAEGLQEALRVLRRFEALQDPFSFPDRPVRVLDGVDATPRFGERGRTTG